MEAASHTDDGKEVVVKTTIKFKEEPSSGWSYSQVLLLLIGFRFINALSIATFFQPDEYFQSLEPAWEIAFGGQSGAWITWVRSW